MVCSPTSTSQLPAPSKQTSSTSLRQQLERHHSQSIYKLENNHFSFNWLGGFPLSHLITSLLLSAVLGWAQLLFRRPCNSKFPSAI